MARAETVALSFEADLSDLKRDLAQLPGITEKEAKGMVKGLEKGFLKAEKAAEKAAKASRKAWGPSNKAIQATTKSTGEMQRGMQSIAQQMPDVISQMQSGTDSFTIFTQQGLQVAQQMGLAEKAVAGLSSMAGPLAIAVAAIGTAAAVTANAISRARDATRLYREEIEDTTASTRSLVSSQLALSIGTGDVAKFLGELQIKTALMVGDLDAVWVSAGQLGSRLADELEPQLRAAGMAVGENANRIQKLNGAMRSGKLDFEEYAEAAQQLEEAEAIHPELLANLAELKDEHAKGRAAINAYTNASLDFNEASAKTTAGVKKTTAAVVDQVGAVDEVAEFWKLASERLTANQAALAHLEKTNKALLTPLERLTYEYQRQLETLHATQAANQDSTQVLAGSLETRLALERHYHAQVLAMKEAEQEADQAAARGQVNTALTVSSKVVSAGQATLEARISQMETISEAGQARAASAFAVSKALAIAQAMIDGALAVQRAIAQFGPPPSPLGIAAIAAAGATTAATMATIAMQQPPSFPMGGLVPADHRMIAAAPGEAVLNRAAVEQLGPQGVDELNRGRRTGPEVVVVNRYEHRIFDAFVADSLATDGPLRRAITASGGRPGHSRRGRR